MANSVATAIARSRPSPLWGVLLGGVAVGVLDLTYAIVVYSPHQPILIPQTIASGLLGKRSYGGGVSTAVLGVALHFFIALSAAFVYYLASRRVPLLIRYAGSCGVAYGACVYLFMHLVVLPLSAAPHGHLPFVYKVYEFIEHCIFVGPPIALSIRHFSR